MKPKIKNIILFTSIAVVLILIYTLLIRKEEEPNVSSSNPTLPTSNPVGNTANVSGVDPETANEILTLLLSVRNITLDDSVFKDTAFISLEDSTVPLDQDGTEGRPNPFAPIGVDASLTTSATLPQASLAPLSNVPVPSITTPANTPTKTPAPAPITPTTTSPALPQTPTSTSSTSSNPSQ